MIKKLAIPFAAIACTAGFTACNDSSSYQSVDSALTSAAVRSFSFMKDDSVMAKLDSVFFSIDLVKGQIFNADSLPKGTKVDKLIPVISTVEGASIIQLTVQRSGKSDTTYNYLTNANDSIDFTNPVTLRIVSPDGLTDCRYTITVNVHQIDADSLTWRALDSDKINSELARINAQRTTVGSRYVYTLTTDGSQYYLGYTDFSVIGDKRLTELTKQGQYVSFSFVPDVNSLTALGEDLYILSASGDLYKSEDFGSTWTATGKMWRTIIGAYDDRQLLGITSDLANIEDAVSGNNVARPALMPVSGISEAAAYKFPMSSLPQMMIVGGRLADGTLSDATWGYDGKSWVKLSRNGLPEGLEYVTVFPYFTYSGGYGSNVPSNTIIAMGGLKADGSISDIVYISTDYGLNWREGNDEIQLPEIIPAFYNAQAYVLETTLSASVYVPKIVKPTESWQCPYVYLFGGVMQDAKTSDRVWTGVINKLSFKPIE